MPFFFSCLFTGFEKEVKRTYSEGWKCGTCWFYRGKIKTFRYLSVDCLREYMSKSKSVRHSREELCLHFLCVLILFGKKTNNTSSPKVIGQDGWSDAIVLCSLQLDCAWCCSAVSQPFSKCQNICALPPAHMHLGHFSLSPSSCFSILLSSILHMYPAQGSYIKVSRASLQGGWLLARTSLLVILPHCSCFMDSWVTLSQILKKLDGESWWTPVSLPLLFRPQTWLMTSMCLVQSNMCRGPGVSNSVH